MKLSDFDYYLPHNLIAQKPAFPRHNSRLLVLDRKSGRIEHSRFFKIVRFFKKGDVLVLNNTKVFPARLFGRKIQREDKNKKIINLNYDNKILLNSQNNYLGGKAEILLLKEIKKGIWDVLLKTKNARVGTRVLFGIFKKFHILCDRNKCENSNLLGVILKKKEDGIFEMKFNKSGKEFWEIVNQIGYAPLPPYIKSKEQENKRTKKQRIKEYQTCFAKYPGSVAAPTAGFHFTPRLLKSLRKKGVQIEFITLHVGLGTFLPVRTEDIKKHKMHSEFAEINKKTARRLNQAKKEGRRIIACGTTVCRTLEAAAFQSFLGQAKNIQVRPLTQEINLFIYPGYRFKFIDVLITNFHLPKTTLLMLVCAFATRRNIFRAYRQAIKNQYRFYSFGDAMLIH